MRTIGLLASSAMYIRHQLEPFLKATSWPFISVVALQQLPNYRHLGDLLKARREAIPSRADPLPTKRTT